MENLVTTQSFWRNKKVFVTGHTGFKGSWLLVWLNQLGAIVKGYSLEPQTNPSLFLEANLINTCEHEIGDIRNLKILKHSIKTFSPDIIFHLAAQPLVRYSYSHPIETFETNIMGTANLLEALRDIDSVRSVVAVTTDKCYHNNEWHWGYREDDKLGGYDPYSASKAGSEIIISSMRNSFFRKASNQKVYLASARAGNVIGGGDWASDRLIPDLMRSFASKKTAQIRNPNSIRPWQHVLESLNGYLLLAEKLYKNGETFDDAWNFGPFDNDAQSVEYIVKRLVTIWGDSAKWLTTPGEHLHEATYLKLDSSKSRARLSWFPNWNLDTALVHTAKWYKDYYNKEDTAFNLCIKNIELFNKKEDRIC
ncbi:MAG TPA: CDP-glucose 4,6-dehydratase [Pseudobdellovibrionaceae bacterium]|nr:CDP-glucose 4,6-dehydratase [Pseudobdellovibrionaceae bacterium]